MHRVESLDRGVLWLWSSHNKVNARLAGKGGPPPRLESPTEGGRGEELWSLGPEVGGGTLIVPQVAPHMSSVSQHTEPFHSLADVQVGQLIS